MYDAAAAVVPQSRNRLKVVLIMHSQLTRAQAAQLTQMQVLRAGATARLLLQLQMRVQQPCARLVLAATGRHIRWLRI